MHRGRVIRGIIWSIIAGFGFAQFVLTLNPIWMVFMIPFIVFMHNRWLDRKDLFEKIREFEEKKEKEKGKSKENKKD